MYGCIVRKLTHQWRKKRLIAYRYFTFFALIFQIHIYNWLRKINPHQNNNKMRISGYINTLFLKRKNTVICLI